MGFFMERYGNYEEWEGSQVIELYNAGKKFHMILLSAVVTELLNSCALAK